MAKSRFNLTKYCLNSSISKSPNKIALKIYTDGGLLAEEWTYRQLYRAIRGVSSYISSLGLEKSSKILLRIGNTSDFPIVFLGTIAAGLVPIPTSAMLTQQECDQILADSQAHLVIHDGNTTLPRKSALVTLFGPREITEMKSAPIGQFAETHCNDPAYLVYTSGTSGIPKGVLHAHRSLLGRKPMYEHWYGINSNDTLLHTGAFNWTYTLGTGLMDPWVNGSTSAVYSGKPDPDAWPNILKLSKATLFASVPSLYRRILKYGTIDRNSFPQLRHCLSAGESLSAGLYEAWLENTGKEIYEAFGMSEISTYISSGPTVPVRPGSPGKFQIGRKIAILPLKRLKKPLPNGETGIIAIDKTELGLMLEYWNREFETKSAYRGDWFLTGDTGYLDSDGYLWYGGRIDDCMNAFGYRVAPQEVESVLLQHSSVSEVAVTQVDVKDGVNVIAAFVVANSDLDEDTLKQWCEDRLAEYKCPRIYQFIEELPRTSTGKVIRRKLVNFL